MVDITMIRYINKIGIPDVLINRLRFLGTPSLAKDNDETQTTGSSIGTCTTETGKLRT